MQRNDIGSFRTDGTNDEKDANGGFTYAFRDKDNLIEYVKTQEEHHVAKTSRGELIELLHEHGIEFDEKYLL